MVAEQMGTRQRAAIAVLGPASTVGARRLNFLHRVLSAMLTAAGEVAERVTRGAAACSGVNAPPEAPQRPSSGLRMRNAPTIKP